MIAHNRSKRKAEAGVIMERRVCDIIQRCTQIMISHNTQRRYAASEAKHGRAEICRKYAGKTGRFDRKRRGVTGGARACVRARKHPLRTVR